MAFGSSLSHSGVIREKDRVVRRTQFNVFLLDKAQSVLGVAQPHWDIVRGGLGQVATTPSEPRMASDR